MAIKDFNLLKIAGLGVALMGMFALVIVVAPAVKGQTVKTRPLMDLKTRVLGGAEIGVTVRDVDEADVKREKLPAPAGVVVDEVRTDSPAARAGVKAGDVIVSFDGERIRSARHFDRLVQETPEGREVEATVVRAGERVSFKVAPVAMSMFSGFDRFANLGSRQFGKRPESFDIVVPKVNPKLDVYRGAVDGFSERLRTVERYRSRLGVSVQELTTQLGDYFGTREGVLVTEVDDSSPARKIGLKAGDVITKIDGYAVRSADELRRWVASAPAEISITILRDRKEQTLKGKMD